MKQNFWSLDLMALGSKDALEVPEDDFFPSITVCPFADKLTMPSVMLVDPSYTFTHAIENLSVKPIVYNAFYNVTKWVLLYLYIHSMLIRQLKVCHLATAWQIRLLGRWTLGSLMYRTFTSTWPSTTSKTVAHSPSHQRHQKRGGNQR